MIQRQEVLPAYLLPDNAFAGSNGTMTMAGVTLSDLAAEYGTPLFVYDCAHIESRAREAVKAFPDGVSYASKAFTCIELIKLLDSVGMKVDVASAGELYVAMKAGVDASRITFHGNNKTKSDIEFAIRAGVGDIVIDSFDEFRRIDAVVENIDRTISGERRFADELGIETGILGEPKEIVDVMIRVNAGIKAETHKYLMTDKDDSKFGISLNSGAAQRCADAINASKTMSLSGIHSHIGSQIFDLEPFARQFERLSGFLKQNYVEKLCIGGGLGVPYVAGESAPTLTDWGDAARKAAAATDCPRGMQITAEPGRSIVASAGITVYRVGTIKNIEGVRTYLSVDGGMSDNPRPVLYGSGYEVFLVRAPYAERDTSFRIVGSHCESGDVLIDNAYLPSDTTVGDLIATPVTGAYGYSMASNYNCMRRPAVVFVREQMSRLVLRRETISETISHDVLRGL